MLYIAKPSDKCCCTCEHWNGVRVLEKDGIYSLKDGEAVCGKKWETNDTDPLCFPLTLPSGAACQEWASWTEHQAEPDLPFTVKHAPPGLWDAATATQF